MSRTLVIAECGSSWDCDLSKAFRLIDAAKASDADVCKFQWTSNAFAMARRRGLGGDAAAMYVKYLQYPVDTLRRLKAHCDEVGIEFACTVFLVEDIAVVDPLVKRFKISAFESQWVEFTNAHQPFGKPVVISSNPGRHPYWDGGMQVKILHCISEYPTPLEKLNIWRILEEQLDGLSDHTTSLTTGAGAVFSGGSVVEKHIRLRDTDKGNPDYGHSLIADDYAACNMDDGESECGLGLCHVDNPGYFGLYVDFIREAEKAL